MNLEELQKELLPTIRTIPDFPKSGIMFKDITTLLNNPKAFNMLMDFLENRYLNYELDYIAGIESRGFIFGAALASRLKLGFIPIRKQGKLPSTTVSQKYVLEYGFDEMEIHIDAFNNKKGAKVLLVDDLIATGGTAKASIKLIESINGNCVEAFFLLRLMDFDCSKEIHTKIFTILDI